MAKIEINKIRIDYSMKFQKGDNRFRMRQGISPPKKKHPKAIRGKIDSKKKMNITANDLLIWGNALYDYQLRGYRLLWTIEEDRVIPEETEQTKQFKNKVMQLREVLNQKFVNIDEVANILEVGFVTGKNVFLYGRGGHAKSEIMQEFLKYVDPEGNESFVQACGEGLTEEKLFGGLNLKKFQETGEIEYLVEKSFMNKKYVVFEELLDSRMSVLLSLKDIIQSGWFRQGSQQFKIRTEFIVVLTNRTKQEVAEDNSIKALLERFPLEHKVEWNSYNAADYSTMFNKVLGETLPEVANICRIINEQGDFVSPRTAIHMAEVFQKTRDLSNLKYFGAGADVIEEVNAMAKEAQDKVLINNVSLKYQSIVANYPVSTAQDCKLKIKAIKALLADLLSYSYSDGAYTLYTDLKNTMNKKIEEIKQQALKQLIDE